jgi:hypothetical protein
MTVRAIVRIVAVLMLLAGISCSDGKSEPTANAHPTATATPLAVATTAATATSTTAQPTASPGSNGELAPELAAFLLSVDEKMAKIRGTTVAPPVPFRFLDQSALNAWVRAEISDAETIEQIRLADGMYTLLGLIPADADMYEEYASLLDAQVLGAYDPEAEEFVVLQLSGVFGPSEEFTYAHEYVHRLQDALFGLDQITEQLKDNSDVSMAFTALVEGDAVTSQQIYALQNLTAQQLAQIVTEAQAALANIPEVPYVLQRSLEFPYVEGATFVDRLRVSNGTAAVDAAFEIPPDSTEQILHPEKYFSREQPVDVQIADSVFGPGWEFVDTDLLGEFMLKTWTEALGALEADSTKAAAGWGGDQYRLATNEAGEFATAIKIAWDTPDQDAAQFYVLLTTMMNVSEDFARIDIGLDSGIMAFSSAGGVIVLANFGDAKTGQYTAIAAGPDVATAMPMLLAMAG